MIKYLNDFYLNNIVEHTDIFIQRTLWAKNTKYFDCNPQVIKHNYDTFSSIRNENRFGWEVKKGKFINKNVLVPENR